MKIFGIQLTPDRNMTTWEIIKIFGLLILILLVLLVAKILLFPVWV